MQFRTRWVALAALSFAIIASPSGAFAPVKEMPPACESAAACAASVPMSSTTPQDCLVDAAPSPQLDSLQSRTREDIWCFWAHQGTTVIYSADTLSPLTAGDLYMCISTSAAITAMGNDCIATFADDEMPCTYPPPAFSCPARSLPIATTGAHYLLVGAHNPFSNTGQIEYILTVQLKVDRAGNLVTIPARLHLAIDDRPETGP